MGTEGHGPRTPRSHRDRPSGAGVHVIIEGMMRGQKTQRKVPGGGKIELYYQQRFLSVTGNVL